MRGGFLCVLVASAVLCTTPAWAQSSDSSGSGGLTVCCGATFGYVGGSGSVSGSVIGPGGGSAGYSAPRHAVVRPPSAAPVALVGGVVGPATLPASMPAVQPASKRTSGGGTWILAGLLVIAVLLVSRKVRAVDPGA